jgi:Flp pilus assembly secretin CpaC
VRARNILLPHGTILALVFLIVCTSWAWAGETIELTPGFVKLFKFDRPVGTVAIGDPRVADTFAPNDKAILLTGKAVGTTNLIILDNDGRELLNGDVVVARGKEAAQRITIHSRSLLHAYQEYSCAPNCVLMGSIVPPRIAPTLPVGSAVPTPPELAAQPAETIAPPAERAAPLPAR